MECIEFTNEKRYVDDFIGLYRKLYKGHHENMQDDNEIRQLLLGTHTLSEYFSIHKYCVYEGKKIVGRFAITTYPEDENAYFGFFECVNDKEVGRFIFNKARQFALEHNYSHIIGPVDASFWIKYRLKINLFDKEPYTGEPYNKDYYQAMFEENGFRVMKHYSSSIYNTVDESFSNKKYEERLLEFTKAGYKIESPTSDKWDEAMGDIYRMITRLFSDFPIYKHLSKEDFASNFASYQQIVDYSMVKMAYFEGKAVGFFISIPNYGNAVYHTSNPLNILKILKTRKNPKEYVMLYMGAEPEHKGLGKALVQSIIKELTASGLPSIGALQMDGKVTQNYVEEMIEKRYEYNLYCTEL